MDVRDRSMDGEEVSGWGEGSDRIRNIYIYIYICTNRWALESRSPPIQ